MDIKTKTIIFASFQVSKPVQTAAILVATWADHVMPFSVREPASLTERHDFLSTMY